MKLISLLKASVISFITFSLFSPGAYAQYCTPAPSFGCLTGDYPSSFSMTGTTMSINDPSLTCTPSGSSLFGGYQDNTAETCAVASPSTVTCTISSNTASTYSTYTTFGTNGSGSPTSTVHQPITESCQIWADWDNSTIFGDGTIQEVLGGMAPLPNAVVTFTVSIPAGIPTGYYRMRLTLSSAAAYPNMDPCMQTSLGPFGSFPYSTGDAIDYTIYVGPTCPVPTALTLGTTTCTSQVVSWTAAAGASGYEWIVDNSASAPTTSGTAVTGTTFTTTTALTPGTLYYAHVRTNCGGGSFSSWVTIPFTTSGPSAITGTTATCPGSTTTLSDAVGGGVWSSSNTNVATVVGGVVHGGTSTGTAVISYTEGGCTSTINVTVGNLPAIVGTLSVCPGLTTQLSDAVPGGTWSSSTGSVATVTNTGIVHGANTGTTTITYSANGCSTTATVNVSTLPAITGGSSVCVSSTLALSDATGGGVWSVSNTNASISASGVVTGTAAGSVNVSYTLGGCAVGLAVTVGNAISPITGTTTFCYTGSTTLSDATAGGTWSSSNNTVASATGTGTGTIHGVAAGTATISYSVGSCSVTTIVTLDPTNGGTITGKDTVCVGTTSTITLSDNESGGVWTSGTTTHAVIDPSTGVVTGMGAGTATITYKVTNTCGTYSVTRVIHVLTALQCATGVNPVTEQKGAKLDVFPNPNGGQFTMNLSSDINEEVRVVVTNLVGEKVKEFKTTTNNAVDIKLNSAEGIYLLSATTAHGKYMAKVVVAK